MKPLTTEEIGGVLFEFAREQAPDGAKIVAVYYKGEPIANGRTKEELLTMLRTTLVKSTNLASIIPHKIAPYKGDFIELEFVKARDDSWLKNLFNMNKHNPDVYIHRSARTDFVQKEPVNAKMRKESPISGQ